MSETEFATAINCIDGRTQAPVVEWIKQKLDVAYVDVVTEPGADGLLSSGDREREKSLYEKVKISVDAHGSHHIVIVGHYDCAANPGDAQHHRRQIVDSVHRIIGWDLPVRVSGLWINERWEVDVICDDNRCGEDGEECVPFAADSVGEFRV